MQDLTPIGPCVHPATLAPRSRSIRSDTSVRSSTRGRDTVSTPGDPPVRALPGKTTSPGYRPHLGRGRAQESPDAIDAGTNSGSGLFAICSACDSSSLSQNPPSQKSSARTTTSAMTRRIPSCWASFSSSSTSARLLRLGGPCGNLIPVRQGEKITFTVLASRFDRIVPVAAECCTSNAVVCKGYLFALP